LFQKLRIGIIGDATCWHGEELTNAFLKKGVSPVFARANQLKARFGKLQQVVSRERVALNELDFVLVREAPGGSLEQVIYRMDALHQLEDCGVVLMNRPGAIEKMVDKYYTSFLLANAGLRTPETILSESFDEALQAFEELGGDVVVKPIFGSLGTGMVRLTDRDTAIRTFHALELGRYVYYLQRYIPHNNHDFRVLMLGEECAAAMVRNSTQWKTNISQGATPSRFEPPDEIIEMSRKAAQAVGADYCGVDLLPSEDGEIYVLEVNSMPAWRGLQSVCTENLAGRLVDFCLTRLGPQK